jgi:3-deoxy-D-arabino-heptulosonate 7-phosphate (DAHP) synthase class II
MLPHTRALLEQLQREEGAEPDAVHGELAEHAPLDDPQYMTLKLRKKHQTNLMRRMLQDAGYADLARMTQFRRERLDDGEDE